MGTPFDFRALREVRPPHTPPQRYDITFVLAPSDGRPSTRRRVSKALLSPGNLSTEPGHQFFDGATLRPVAGAARAYVP